MEQTTYQQLLTSDQTESLSFKRWGSQCHQIWVECSVFVNLLFTADKPYQTGPSGGKI